MKICVVGGGHIGTTLACYVSHYDHTDHVSLFTRRPMQFASVLRCNDWEGGFSFETSIDCISADPSEAASKADLVFIALPHFAVEKAFQDISKHVSEKACIGVVPGGGGCEFFFNKYFSNAQTLFGFQRVPFTAKLEKYGRETNLKSWKPYSVVATQKRDRIDHVCDLIEKCGLSTRKAQNYLSIALTPTNPVLHTSRTYDIFGQYSKEHIFPEMFKYYTGWTDKASSIMLEMDDELHILLDHVQELDTSAIRPLTEHYDSYDIRSMTKKLSSIPTFQTVYAPLRKAEAGTGYVADLSSRMFTEDFPWGLAIIRSYCEIIGTGAKTMDEVLGWYSDYMGLQWYVKGAFCGKDIMKTGAPQAYGINTREELLSFYL